MGGTFADHAFKESIPPGKHGNKLMAGNAKRFRAYLGFTIVAGKIAYAAGVIEDLRHNLKRLTGRSWGVSMPYRLAKIKLYARGLMNYYGIAQYYKPMETIDDWLRRRIRMCFLKQWRYKRTRVGKLISLGIPKDFAVLTGGSSKSYWRLSRTYATNAGMSNAWLTQSRSREHQAALVQGSRLRLIN